MHRSQKHLLLRLDMLQQIVFSLRVVLDNGVNFIDDCGAESEFIGRFQILRFVVVYHLVLIQKFRSRPSQICI